MEVEKQLDHGIHVLMLPFPAQGHINPLLRFSHLLLLHSPNTTITFLNTHPNHLPTIANSTPSSNIRFLSIPDGLPPHLSSAWDSSLETFFMHVDAMEQQQGVIEDIILSSMPTPSPISCIVSDSFLPWTQRLANRLRIKRVNFWTGNATTLYAQQLFATHRILFEESGDVVKVMNEAAEDDDPFFSLVHTEIVPQYIGSKPQRSIQFMKRLYEQIEDAACIVVGTSQILEGRILKAMPIRVAVRCCVPLKTLPEEDEGAMVDEHAECLSWLDGQNKLSVLYISFGSVAQLSADQIEEIALGVEASGQPFLWVVRHENRSEAKTQQLLEELMERRRDRGMVIEWAPQLRVLGHPAVGGFLTHCGWNSTLESIAMGVPMLCCPIFAEQPLNSVLIEKVWKVGMGMGKGENGVVERKEVERMVVRLLQGEEGKAVRERAGELAQQLRNDSMNNEALELRAFLQHL